MLKFEDEIKKFKLSLEVDDIEEDIQHNQVEDLLDILRHITKEQKNTVKKE